MTTLILTKTHVTVTVDGEQVKRPKSELEYEFGEGEFILSSTEEELTLLQTEDGDEVSCVNTVMGGTGAEVLKTAEAISEWLDKHWSGDDGTVKHPDFEESDEADPAFIKNKPPVGLPGEFTFRVDGFIWTVTDGIITNRVAD